VLLAALGVTVVLDVVSVQVAGHALVWPYRALAADLRSTSWHAGITRLAALGALVVGLLLVGAGVHLPHRSVPLRSEPPWLAVVTTRRSLRRAAARSALGVDGVDDARVELHHRRLEVRVRTPLRDPAGLGEAVAEAVGQRLAALGVDERYSLRVSLQAPFAVGGGRGRAGSIGPGGDQARETRGALQ